MWWSQNLYIKRVRQRSMAVVRKGVSDPRVIDGFISVIGTLLGVGKTASALHGLDMLEAAEPRLLALPPTQPAGNASLAAVGHASLH